MEIEFSNSLETDLDFILVRPAFSKIISIIFSILNYFFKKKRLLDHFSDKIRNKQMV